MPENAKAAVLQQVNEFLASDRATEEKVDRLINFLADEIDALDSNEQQVLLSQTQMGDPVAQEIADTKAQQEELLKKLGGSALLQEDATATDEDVTAFLAYTEQHHHKDDKAHTKDDKIAPELGRNPEARVEHALKALALEATTENLQQPPSAIALSSQQESAMPHMMFGGVFLLGAAVLLTVMTKRARKPHASKDDAYAYYMHQ